MRVASDGDIIVYRAAAAVEPTHWDVKVKGNTVASFRYKKEAVAWVEDQPEDTQDRFEYVSRKEIEPVENCFNLINIIIRGIIDATGAAEHLVFLSPAERENNFRYDVAVTKPYKGNRKADKPTYYAEARDFLVRKWKARIAKDRLEADDELGIFQYMHYLRLVHGVSEWHDETCIASIDKDLDMIPGWHYNFVDKKMYWVTEKEAIRNYWVQMLMGDTSDNITGVPNIGAAKAKKIVAKGKGDETATWVLIQGEYQNAYGDSYADKMNEMHQLLWIKRFRDE